MRRMLASGMSNNYCGRRWSDRTTVVHMSIKARRRRRLIYTMRHSMEVCITTMDQAHRTAASIGATAAAAAARGTG